MPVLRSFALWVSAYAPRNRITWSTLWVTGFPRPADNFGCGQSLLLPGDTNRKSHWPDIIWDKGLGRRRGKRRKEKKIYIYKIVQFVGSVLRMKYFLLVPSDALHPTSSKQARYAAGMIFMNSRKGSSLATSSVFCTTISRSFIAIHQRRGLALDKVS